MKYRKSGLLLKTMFVFISIGVLVLFLFVPPARYTSGLENINELVLDTKKKPEFPKPENFIDMDHPFDHRLPSWHSYHTKNQRTWIKRKLDNLLSFLWLKKSPPWSMDYFLHLLKEQTKEKERQGRVSEYVVRITPSENDRFIIWGDLSGAYHSLTRDLQKLISLHILDENLKLISPNDHLVFMGDVAARSPFIAETLTLIIKLHERNPEKCFLLAGNNERRGSWQTYGLGEELQIEGKHLPLTSFSFYNLVDRYFQTLPLGIYLSTPPHNTNDFVRLSHFSMLIPSKESYRNFVDLLDDSHYAKELLENRKKEPVKIINISNKEKETSTHSIEVKAIIKSVYKLKEHKKHDGLHMLMQDKNAMAWTILSSPTTVTSYCFDFYNDAFTILQLAPQLNDWTIKLYYRDVRTKEDFKTKNYNFITGARLPA